MKKMVDPQTSEGGWAIATALWYVVVFSVYNLQSQMVVETI